MPRADAPRRRIIRAETRNVTFCQGCLGWLVALFRGRPAPRNPRAAFLTSAPGPPRPRL